MFFSVLNIISFIVYSFIIGGLHYLIFGRGIGSTSIIGYPELAAQEEIFQINIAFLVLVTIILVTFYYFFSISKRFTKRESLLQSISFFSLLSLVTTPFLTPLIYKVPNLLYLHF